MKKITNYLDAKHTVKLLSFSFFLLLWMIGFSANAQTTATFNANGNFITPAGVITATVEAWGAGGAGGGSTSNSDGGGGGGGGAYSKVTGTAVSGTMAVTVGVGGTGDTGAGNNGTDSSFNSVVLAKGGIGGSVTGGTGGPGGAGGLSTASTGTTKFSGGTGGRGRDNNSGSGGPGGSSAGTAANGNSGAGSWANTNAIVAPTGGGNGGAGGAPGVDGSNGTAPGGGGGGGGDTTTNGGSGAAGRVVLTYTCPTYSLTSATTATGPFCGASASVVTLTSTLVALPNGTYTVTYNLTGGNSATGNTATMTVASGVGTFTTSVLNPSATATTVTITNLTSGVVSAGACTNTISTNNTVAITVNFTPTANAGTALTAICQGGTTAALGGSVGGSATGGVWTVNVAGGTFSGGTIATQTWTPPAAYSGTATLTLTTTGGSCGTTTATKTITVNAPPTSVAGNPVTTCYNAGAVNITSGSTATNQTSVQWSTTNGTGSFANNTNLTTCTYTPSAGDIAAGSVNITLTAILAGCTSAVSSKTLTITSPPATVGAITGSANVCQTAGGLTYSVAAVSGATNYTWTVPTGWTINSGQGTASISVTSGNVGQNGSVSVVASNSCGSSANPSATSVANINPVDATNNTGSTTNTTKTDGNLTVSSSSGGTVRYGYIKFPLTVLPAGSVVTASTLSLVNNGSGALSGVNNDVRAINLDPVAATAASIFAGVPAGTSYSSTTWSNTGTIALTLNAAANADIQSKIATGYIAMGLERGAGTSVYVFTGHAGGANAPKLAVTYTEPRSLDVVVTMPTVSAGSPFTKTCATNPSGAVIGEANASGYSYSWSPSTGLSSATVSNPTANPATTTTYTVTKTDNATLCSAQASVLVTVNLTPTTVSVSPGFTKTCSTNTSGLTIGETNDATATYSWTPTTGLTGATTSNPLANPATTTTYTVVKTKTSSGCTATAQVTVTVNTTAPTVSAGTPFTKTCIANTSGATIGEANDATATYSWSPATGLSSTTISNPVANPATTQTYTLTKTSTLNGCSATAQVTVTVNNTLAVNAGTDFTKTCATNPTGKAIGEANVSGNTYSWSPTTGLSDPNISAPIANPLVTTTYTVTKTNIANGCVATDNVIVTVDTTPAATCVVTPFTKTCVTNPTGATIGEANDANYTYSWTPTTGLTGPTTSNPLANPATTTTYTVVKTRVTSGCTSSGQVTVTVNTTTPTVAALTGTQTVCEGSTTTFASSTPDGVWSSNDTNIATVTNGLVTAVAAGTTNINYTVTGTNGCTTTVSRAVTVHPLPTAIVASGTTVICDGNSTTLNGSAVIPYTQVISQTDNFNGTPTYVSANGFAQKANNATVGGIALTNNIDSSSYMATTITAGLNSTSITSTLTSPAIDATSYGTPLTFTYQHAYSRGSTGTRTAVVEVSTNNGTSWTQVDSHTANVGGDNNFVAESIDLNAYANAPSLRVRFNTTITVSLFQSGYWAIDNPTLSGSAAINPLYSWTADTASGTNGLPGTAATPSTGNASISVNPSATTNYTLMVQDPVTQCTKSAAAVTVTVKPTPTVIAPAPQTFCNGASVAAIVLSGTPSGVTYDISGGDAIGLTSVTGVTQIPAYTAIAGTAVISITPQFNGCTGTAQTYAVTVYPTPTVTAPANQSYCNGAVTSPISLSGSPSGVVYDISGGAAIGLNNATGVTEIPSFTAILGSATVTITPRANGCTGNAVTYAITVNPIVTPTFSPVAAICSGGSLSALPTTSNNGITGTWSPALSNTSTTTYTFTPTAGQCTPAELTTLEIVVNTNTTYYADTDLDGYGDAENTIQTCLGLQPGYVTNNTDCNDNDHDVYRNGSLYVDFDGDSYNDGTPTVTICYGATVPVHYVAENNGTDCNDFNAEVNFWHEEVAGNLIDDNCDGHVDEVGQTSYIIPAQCGSTLSAISNTIYAYSYPEVTGYRFEITNGATVRKIDSNTNSFSLANLPGGATYGTAYTIRVSVQTDGFWQIFGNPCVVTTPANPLTTNVIASQCGTTLASMSTTIYCGQVTAANHYRFEVTDGVNPARTYDSPQNRFNMLNLTGSSTYGTTYSVRVALRFGAVWKDYGISCNITTPASPGGTNIITSQCGITVTNSWATIYANPVADAAGYRFEVTTTSPNTLRYVDRPIANFNLHQLAGGYTSATVYTVRVSILFNGIYQPFGSACNIITAAGISKQAVNDEKVFAVNAYPNPYTDTFKLDLNTSDKEQVAVKVYDMIGKLIESRDVSVSELKELTIGDRYPSGVYNVIVSQGDEVKTLRIIKR